MKTLAADAAIIGKKEVEQAADYLARRATCAAGRLYGTRSTG